MGVRCGYGVPLEGHCFGIVSLCRVMQNGDPERKNSLSAPNSHGLIFSCIPFSSENFICFKMTSTRDVLYNQCKPNSRENFLLSYPWRRTQISMSGMKEKNVALTKHKLNSLCLYKIKAISHILVIQA